MPESDAAAPVVSPVTRVCRHLSGLSLVVSRHHALGIGKTQPKLNHGLRAGKPPNRIQLSQNE